MVTSAAQQEYMRRNNVKPANVKTHFVVHFEHVDWSEDLDFVAIEQFRGVESDLSKYIFEGVQYTPVSMGFKLPKDTTESNGNVTMSFPRVGTVVKKLMKQITPANAGKPIYATMKMYQTGIDGPVWEYSGTVSRDFPKIGGSDVSVQVSIYNPSLLTSNRIVTVTEFPELKNA